MRKSNSLTKVKKNSINYNSMHELVVTDGLYASIGFSYLVISLGLCLGFMNFAKAESSWSIVRTINEGAPYSLINATTFIVNFLLFIFGYAAYVLPVILIISAVQIFSSLIQQEQIVTKSKNIKQSNQFVNIWSKCNFITGSILSICALSVMLNILNPYENWSLPGTNGGLLGALLADNLNKIFKQELSIALLSIILINSMFLMFGLSWLRLLYSIAYGVSMLLFTTTKNITINVTFKFRSLYVKYFNKKRMFIKPILQSAVLEKSVTSDIPNNVINKAAVNQKMVARTLRNKYTFNVELLNLPNSQNEDHALNKTSLQNHEIENLLEDFGVKAVVKSISVGPVVTRFELELAPGIKANKVTALSKDLARQLKVISVRVVEVIPGKSFIGIEIPNDVRNKVWLRSILQSNEYKDNPYKLPLALGCDISGKPKVVDLLSMPHLLVAGTTGAGKSVAINVMLLSLIYSNTPEQLRLLLIDPKMLELSAFEHIGHLLTPVITDMKKARMSLKWCVKEMDRRYQLLADHGVRNIVSYNDNIRNNSVEQDILPYIVVVIDEFADMMMTVRKEVEELIARLAQKARAAGIHLILATQRPSVDVITGLIKANIPCRVAFQVAARVDSRTILDSQGAEQLLGHGDMLYLAPGSGVPIRVHGALVEDIEVHRVIKEVRSLWQEQYVLNLDQEDPEHGSSSFADDLHTVDDELYEQALEIVVSTKKTSISYLQRRLRIGYNRAARLIETLTKNGIIGSYNNSAKQVLIRDEKF